ncbi:hypothetical protein IC793_00910 [Acinetobacter seifertii]|nr:hypothetical protein [Acinetobacter seifertii]QNX16012.1 hypothetical protein IC793_00910 [Acinetobacter seifertii]
MSSENNMKYIMFKQEREELVELIPVIFPNKLVHKDVADALMQTPPFKDCSVQSAGSISLLNLEANGHSETLNVASNPRTDSFIIKMNDYGAGYQ